MWFIAGSLVNLCTFPGIIVHQFFYLIAAKFYKVEAALSLFNFTQFLSADLVIIGDSDRLRIGRKLQLWAIVGSALTCCLVGGLNQFTPKGSTIESVLFWIAISIGVQGFPLKGTPLGRGMGFIWLDAMYGMILYFVGQIPHAALVTWVPSLGLTGSRLY